MRQFAWQRLHLKPFINRQLLYEPTRPGLDIGIERFHCGWGIQEKLLEHASSII